MILTVASPGASASRDPGVLAGEVFTVGFVVHPAVRAAWEELGGTPTGAHRYRFPRAALDAALEVVERGCVDVAGAPGRSRAARLDAAGLGGHAAAKRSGPAGPTVTVRLTERTATVEVTCGPVTFAGVEVPPLGSSTRVCFDDALAVLEAARSARWPCADGGAPANFARVAALAHSSVLALPVPGAPGLARVRVGAGTLADTRAVIDELDVSAPAALDALEVIASHSPERVITATCALEAAATVDGWAVLHVDAAVVDAAVAAEPVELDVPGLAGYQSRFVSSYVGSGRGAVCALPPGLGKTVCAAASFAELARREPGWTALVVAPSAVLAQWEAELARWAPGVRAVVAERATTPQVRAELATGAHPTCVLVTPQYLAAFAEVCGHRFSDVCVDEAAWLRNPRSGRGRAAWELRSRARRGLALSGTPVTSDVDDLAALVAWACGDRHLFEGVPLSRWQATWDSAGPDGFTLAEVCGATVFCDTTGAPAADLAAVPDVDVEVHRLEATPADRAVSDAVWDLLERRRDEVASARDVLAGADAASAAARAARSELAAARMRVAATMAFARLAHSAASVAGTSTLAGAGTVAEGWARHGAGAKLPWVRDLVTGEATAGRSVLVFSDSEGAAAELTAELTAAGVSSVTLAGGRRTDRDAAVAAFTSGQAQVALVGPAAQLGVNLACADVVVHLDCGASGTTSKLVQRCARAARLGATGQRVRVVVPVVADTVDDALWAPLAARLSERVTHGGGGFGDDVPAHVDELLAARALSEGGAGSRS